MGPPLKQTPWAVQQIDAVSGIGLFRFGAAFALISCVHTIVSIQRGTLTGDATQWIVVLLIMGCPT
eukprot:4043403-Amphidinium_carterae.1